MDEARRYIASCEADDVSPASGTVFVARCLRRGRGRFRRVWHATEGGLWLALLLADTMLPAVSALLPLSMGVGVCETVRHFGVEARIKWVNDVQARGAKLAGVLCETVRGRYEDFLLIGIGLNVNNGGFPGELVGRAAAMKDFLGGELDVAVVGAELLARLRYEVGRLFFEEAQCLSLVHQSRGLHPLIRDLVRLSDTPGRRVRYGYNAVSNPEFTATAIGFDRHGGLVMELDDGTRVTKHSGEVVYV